MSTEDPTTTKNPPTFHPPSPDPIPNPNVDLALMRIRDLRDQMALMTETLNNLEQTIGNIVTNG